MLPFTVLLLLLTLCVDKHMSDENSEETRGQAVATKEMIGLMDSIFKEYNHRIRPCGEPDKEQASTCPKTGVKVSVYLRTIDDINDKNQNFVLQLTFRQSWLDKRLAFGKKDEQQPAYLTLSASDKQYNVWVPDTVLVNEKTGSRSALDHNNVMIRVAPSGLVTYAYRLTPTLSCRMDFRSFPRDQHHCYMDISSYSHTTQHIVYGWNETGAILMSPSFKNNVANFEILEVKRDVCKTETSLGSYSCVRLALYLKRVFNLAQFTLLYLPGLALVFVAWLSMWFSNQTQLSRVSIVLGCLSTLIIHAALVSSSLPTASSFRSWDLWFAACLLFVVLCLVQHLIAYRMARKDKGHVELLNPQVPTSLSSQMSQIYSPSVVSFAENEHPLKLNLTKKQMNVTSKKSTVGPRGDRRPSIQMDGNQGMPLIEEMLKEEGSVIKPRKVNAVVKKWRKCTRSQKFDVLSRIFFFIAFAFFNMVYWSQ